MSISLIMPDTFVFKMSLDKMSSYFQWCAHLAAYSCENALECQYIYNGSRHENVFIAQCEVQLNSVSIKVKKTVDLLQNNRVFELFGIH